MLPTDAFWASEADELADILYANLAACAKLGSAAALAGLGDGVSIDFTLVNQAVQEWAKGMSLELAKGITETSRKAATSAISDWIGSGQSLDDLLAALTPWFGKTRAEMIGTTEVTRAFQAGNVEAWRESGVVEGIRWYTAEDELVCPICGPLAGQTDGLDGDFGGIGQPPAHTRCRCWTIPVVTAE